MQAIECLTHRVNNMETTINANLNNADCIKSINNIGSTTYQNICNGTHSVVPWGSGDVLTVVIMLTVIGVLIYFMSKY